MANEGVLPIFFFIAAENFDISTCYVVSHQNVISDTNTITKYKKYRKLQRGIVKNCG